MVRMCELLIYFLDTLTANSLEFTATYMKFRVLWNSTFHLLPKDK